MCLFYILHSYCLDKYYIGHTCDKIEERVRKHNTNHKGFTGKANDWIVKLTEKYPTKQQAYQRERQVKAWKSRTAIENLIQNSI